MRHVPPENPAPHQNRRRSALSLRAAKRDLRRQLIQKRQELLSSTQDAAVSRLLDQLIHLPVYARAQRIGLYAAERGELPTRPLFDQAVLDGKEVAFPFILEDRLHFRLLRKWGDLAPGAFGILEPLWGSEIAPERIDLLLVPGVAFDRQGSRLGRGGGYFDRLLASPGRPRQVAGIGYAFQLVESVPVGPEDQKLDFVVTDQGVFRT